MATTRARQRLSELLNNRELIIAPGVFDGISAHLTKRTGHVAAYMTGAGVAASGFGLPDIGLVTATEMAGNALAHKITVPAAAALAAVGRLAPGVFTPPGWPGRTV